MIRYKHIVFLKPVTVLFIFFLLAACNKHQKNVGQTAQSVAYKISITDSLEIPVPLNIQHPFSMVSGNWNYTEKTICFETDVVNDTVNINCYNFQKKYWKQIHLPLKGVNRVLSNGNFYFVTDSTFLYFPSIVSQALLIDNEGSVKNKFTYSENMNIREGSSGNKAPRIFYNDSLFTFDITEYRSLKDSETFKLSKLYALYNYRQNKIKKIISYPDEFHGAAWSTNDVARYSIYYDDKIMFSFSKSPYIYVYDLNGNLIKKGLVKFDEIKEAHPPSANASAIEKALLKENNGYYSKIIYDKWHKVFYRIGIFYEKSGEIRSVEDLQRAIKNRKTGIIAFNEKLEILSKAVFNYNDKLSDLYFFTNKNGFYILKDEELEGKMIFYKMELAKKQKKQFNN